MKSTLIILLLLPLCVLGQRFISPPGGASYCERLPDGKFLETAVFTQNVIFEMIGNTATFETIDSTFNLLLAGHGKVLVDDKGNKSILHEYFRDNDGSILEIKAFEYKDRRQWILSIMGKEFMFVLRGFLVPKD